MKRSLLLLCLFSISIISFAQQTIDSTITHDDIQREYMLYIPDSYTGNEATPLVFNFHGYTSNASEQMLYGDFRSIADTAGFLLVHPMGTLDDTGTTYWNAQWGGETDDIGFTGALLDSLMADYNIDPTRVYSTGMSNGGFMSHTLACDLSSRFAAIASVTGTMTKLQPPVCVPDHPMPVMQIHGTADLVVPYEGNSWMETVENVVNHWVSFNNCSTTPVVIPVPDVNMTDGSTAERIVYQNGDNGTEVEFYKIENGGHTWPGTAFFFTGTNLDFNASEKIWRFFAQYDINGRVATTAIDLLEADEIAMEVFPNPTDNLVNLKWEDATLHAIRLLNVLGVEMENRNVTQQTNANFSLMEKDKGIYFFQFYNDKNEIIGTRKLIKN